MGSISIQFILNFNSIALYIHLHRHNFSSVTSKKLNPNAVYTHTNFYRFKENRQFS